MIFYWNSAQFSIVYTYIVHREATQFKAQAGCYGLNFKSALGKIKESFEIESSTLVLIEIQLNVQYGDSVRGEQNIEIKTRKERYTEWRAQLRKQIQTMKAPPWKWQIRASIWGDCDLDSPCFEVCSWFVLGLSRRPPASIGPDCLLTQ